MPVPSMDTFVAYASVCFSIMGALLAAVWISLVIWTFRDMRARSRDPFAQILAVVVVAILPLAGLLVYLILRPSETLAEAYERALEEEALLQEIEERPACPGCSRVVDPHWILCPHCHTRLRKACPDCNALMELQWNLCPYCGNQQIDPFHAGPPVSVPLSDEQSLAGELPAADLLQVQDELPTLEHQQSLEEPVETPPADDIEKDAAVPSVDEPD